MSKRKELDYEGLRITSITCGGVDPYWIYIHWQAPHIGYGRYELEKKNEQWVGRSEAMDKGKSKEFIKKLMALFIEQTKIVE